MHAEIVQIRHAFSNTVEDAVSFYQHKDAVNHVTVTVSALMSVKFAMFDAFTFRKPFYDYHTIDGESDRIVSFKFGYKCVTIDDGRHEPMTFGLKGFENVLDRVEDIFTEELE